MDLKTSLLVNRQLPEFVREEYPLFISFLEAYYEFLETERYIDGESQKNNLTEKLKELKNISDIDASLDDFEDQFFNTFISYLPKDAEISKDFLIKNILPFYQSKGTQKSFEYLFRLLFGKEITIEYPGEKVLRASSGKWVVENVLRAETEIYSKYISDGIKKEYDLPYEIDSSLIEITVDDQIEKNYYIRKEQKKIYFNVAPSSNSVIKVFYLGFFNIQIFKNRQILGKTSNTTAIIEKVTRRNVGRSNFYQFFINEKTKIGTFQNGEIIQITIVNENGVVIPFELQTLSNVQSVNIIKPGSGYNPGDVVIFRGDATRKAVAVVDTVSAGNIESITVKVGNFGAGYQVGTEVYANGYPTSDFLAIIDDVDDSGFLSPNTFTFYEEVVISDYSSTLISAADYGFPGTKEPTENVNTVFANCFVDTVVTNLGPATNVSISVSNISTDQTINFSTGAVFDISKYNSIGTIKINDPGTGYSVGDEIIFVNSNNFSGQGAKAFVSEVNGSGGITRVTIVNGGYYYDKNNLPQLNVDSVGTGANLAVEYFMGQGVDFNYVPGDGIQGKILSIKIVDSGKGYTGTPFLDVSLSGNGNAVLNAEMRTSFVNLPGRWISEDGLLSTDEVRIQGQNYYIDFSYVIASQIEFQRYKDILKLLLNPVGSISYSRYQILDKPQTNLEFVVLDEFSRQVAGTVNVASDYYGVWGTNTYFALANTIGILPEGTYILVNSEIRIVNSIINNTEIWVSDPYDYNANDQIITIIPVPYDAITTEYWRELAITLEGPRTIVITTEKDY